MDIGQEKLLFLETLLKNQDTSDKNQLLNNLLSINQIAAQQGINFTNEETENIFREYTRDMSPAQRKKVDMIRTLAKVMGNKKRK